MSSVNKRTVILTGAGGFFGINMTKVLIKEKEIKESLSRVKEGPMMLVIKVKKGSRETLGRPTISPLKIKKRFTKFLAH